VLVGSRSIIRLLITLPRRTIDRVVNRFKSNLVAVPAFNRVEPVNTSGPRFGATTTVGRRARGIFSQGLKQIKIVVARRFLASTKAPQTNGVVPLAAIPTTTSVA